MVGKPSDHKQGIVKQIPLYGMSKEKRLDKYGDFCREKGIIIDYTLIDDEDFDKVNQYRWYKTGTGHVSQSTHNKNKILLHRFVMGAPDGINVDHIDHDPLNNQKSNLRFCNQGQNCRNSLKQKTYGKKLTSSKYKGVSWSKQKKNWRSLIMINNRSIRLGHFKNEIDAAKAYNEAAKKYFGEFAHINQIEK